MNVSSSNVLKSILAGGSLLFAAWGLSAPRSLGRAMGVSEETARFVGVRELGAGLLLATGRGRAQYLPRVIFDASDALTMRQRRPGAALGAAAFAALAVAALALEPHTAPERVF